MVASTTPAANSESSKEDSSRPLTITASTALDTGRQVVTSVQSLQGYSHVQPMISIESQQQQQQQQNQQRHESQSTHDQTNVHNPTPEMMENTKAHLTPVPSPHQVHSQQPANDTAFPGGQLRHNYSIHQPQQQHLQQSHLLSALSHPTAIKQDKSDEKDSQVRYWKVYLDIKEIFMIICIELKAYRAFEIVITATPYITGIYRQWTSGREEQSWREGREGLRLS